MYKIDKPSELCDIKEGIWYINKIPNGKHASYLAEKLEDLPKAMTKATLVQHKNKIATNLEYKMKKKEEVGFTITLKEIIKVMFESVN